MQPSDTLKNARTNRSFVMLARLIGKVLLAIVALLSVYAVIALIGTLISVNNDFLEAKEGQTIFVTTNGFHTEVVLPVANRRDKCFQILNEATFKETYANCSYIAFGWGDHDFYMDAYHHAFPSLTTILDAAILPGESLMHIKFYSQAPTPDADVKAIKLTPEQYEQLVTYIADSFQSTDGKYALLNQPGYGKHDFFYQAVGKYHLFNTCNSWTGRGLRTAGVQMSWWTPFEYSVFYYLK